MFILQVFQSTVLGHQMQLPLHRRINTDVCKDAHFYKHTTELTVLQLFHATTSIYMHIQYKQWTRKCRHMQRSPARRLNKNPPTTPDMHHPLSWPRRNILQSCQGNSLGNSLPDCHPSWGGKKRGWMTMIIYVFYCSMKGVYVCPLQGSEWQ